MAVRVLCYKVNLFYNKLIALGDAKNTIGCWISESCDLNDKKLHCSLETEECLARKENRSSSVLFAITPLTQD